MDTSGWLATTREDGETVGYLQPLADDYALVQPRSLLGHAVGPPTEFLEAEELLIERGISEPAERWLQRGATGDMRGGVVILGVSADGIIVAHADLRRRVPADVGSGWPGPISKGVCIVPQTGPGGRAPISAGSRR